MSITMAVEPVDRIEALRAANNDRSYAGGGEGATAARLLLAEFDQEDRLPGNAVVPFICPDDDPASSHRLQLAGDTDFGAVHGIGSRGDRHAAAGTQPIPAAELDGAVLTESPG
jgi:hypothetical protein